MRYIRTKYGIYDIKTSVYHLFSGFKQVDSHCLDYELNPNECKTSDKLKDLMDRFVVVYGKHHTHYKRSEFNRSSHRLLCLDIKDDKKKCYGSVWTNRGLIYVAELNSEGELELI